MTSIAKKMSDEFTIFKFDGKDVRVVKKDHEPWFVAVDLCNVLNLQNPSKALKVLDENERSNFKLGRQGDANIISESGMYTLILRCRDAIKQGTVPYRVRKWVTSEVLPSIRKTGSYHSSKTTVQQRNPLKNAVNLLVRKKGILYPEAYSLVHQRFNVEHIDELTTDQLPQAIEYVHKMAMEGEYLGKDLPKPKQQITDEELITLCWSWNYLIMCCSVMEDVYPLLNVAEHRLAAKFHTLPKESSYNSGMVQSILQKLTAHLEPSNFNNSRVLNNLRQELLSM
ncbi:prophage antirepressor-like protein [Xenorhabdus cabanillasii]|uniref:Prophage antirepressor-like protein n=1 Tax=Xenorhabdus cabanillasii TaxID=351673 RepID=A0A3D9UHA8_9GAMM|nr:BRO family protein [Xenorhabdus cabanillasii]REF28676.1 prophage antirepressor-like protein [Xenorhabdus cabanillasii]